MTYQWLRVYPEDLLGDVKARQLSDSEKWYLIIAWQTARNAKAYGELRNDDGTPIHYPAFALIAGITPRRADEFIIKLFALGLAEPAADGACTFPKLRQMQGDDVTNVERQRRYRNAHRNADVTASNGPVTGQKQKQKTESLKAVEQLVDGTAKMGKPGNPGSAIGMLVGAVGRDADEKTERTFINLVAKYALCEADVHRARESLASSTAPNLARYAAGVLKKIGEERAA